MRAAVMIVALGAAALAGCGTAAAGPPAASHPARHLTAGRPAAGVMVTGRLVMEGGPIRPGGSQPLVRPIRGTVTFTAGHAAVTATVPASGLFSVRLAPGTYRAQALTPNIVGPGGRGTACPDPSPVRVGSHPVRVTIACIVP